ncbi:hypothetical protein [Novosphingobium sp. ZW T3_23]|uniref:hypothetical protein n=1 Tax=Novosphingobium sp. ZW T3_23 TaxID=3378084 RepID=UPI003853254B
MEDALSLRKEGLAQRALLGAVQHSRNLVINPQQKHRMRASFREFPPKPSNIYVTKPVTLPQHHFTTAALLDLMLQKRGFRHGSHPHPQARLPRP